MDCTAHQALLFMGFLRQEYWIGLPFSSRGTDVSRGWPCNGRFTEKQKLLYECALATSDYMFSVIRPGMPMADVDSTIRRYNFERLKDAGVLNSFEDIGKLMWHGGSHHIGYDVHDAVERPEILAPGMAFCVDVGIPDYLFQVHTAFKHRGPPQC